MARLSVELPDELRRKVETRAAESGHPTVEQYVQALIRADAEFSTDADLGGPPHLEVGTDDELESLLAQMLDSGEPSIEATPELWARLEERARLERIAGCTWPIRQLFKTRAGSGRGNAPLSLRAGAVAALTK